VALAFSARPTKSKNMDADVFELIERDRGAAEVPCAPARRGQWPMLDRKTWTADKVVAFATLCAVDKAAYPDRMTYFETIGPKMGRMPSLLSARFGIACGTKVRTWPPCGRKFFSAHFGERICNRNKKKRS
jgi:hypothetical protein